MRELASFSLAISIGGTIVAAMMLFSYAALLPIIALSMLTSFVLASSVHHNA